jgi:uncharacterized protein
VTTSAWTAGSTVTVRNLARSDGTVTTATPAIAIRDDERSLALFIPAGTTAKENYLVAPADRATAVGRAAASRFRTHHDRVWAVSSLRVFLPGEAFSVWLFFDHKSEFAGWYGNLEAPFVRTPIGVDTRDHGLDVVADAGGRWRWKDEEEFAQRLELGLDSAEHQRAVRGAGQGFIRRLEAGRFPFDQDWPLWRAPASWAPRPLPPDWNTDFGTAALLR